MIILPSLHNFFPELGFGLLWLLLKEVFSVAKTTLNGPCNKQILEIFTILLLLFLEILLYENGGRLGEWFY